MKTLLILRHAKSSWDNDQLADFDRPLNKRGRRQAPQMGQLLTEQGLGIDLVVSSTARRARETAEAVMAASGFDGEVRYSKAFYEAPPVTYLASLNALSDDYDCVLVVGHNPGLQALVALLTGRDEAFPTAALAQIALPIDSWSAFGVATRGRLVNLWRPSELGGE